jgi:hypothetical protein
VRKRTRSYPRPVVDAGGAGVVYVDATLVTAHSEKQQAAPTFKRGFGFHPVWAFADHGPAGTGELAVRAAQEGHRRVERRPTTPRWSAPP